MPAATPHTAFSGRNQSTVSCQHCCVRELLTVHGNPSNMSAKAKGGKHRMPGLAGFALELERFVLGFPDKAPKPSR